MDCVLRYALLEVLVRYYKFKHFYNGKSISSTASYCALRNPGHIDSEANNFDSDENALDKRHERYGFGLGRRSYVLTTNSQGKRLPSYDFGLGKRSRYSFGLGKRTFEEDYPESEYALNFLTSNLDDPNIKRGRPYSFGLGKRAALRNNDQRYNFGLGKR
ncbi:unnamed protein product [Hermetia illucens]|uniref:Allatostatin A n=1 Tax=Hermetia illucens TaxID=343691 RepID=A0A7R8UQ80_HERIL|nr:unnamed protein product [Hermetia illucens]